MRRAGPDDRLRRVLWVASLITALVAISWVLIRRGVEWGVGGAP
jgi:hypothetical protein